MFTATKSQVWTYLIVICLFSISFLVFVNATISFVVTTVIGETAGVGNTVGTLGFADEVVVIIACPLWGILSDCVGARSVCVISYAIIAVALVLFVQAHDVLPQLLLIRLLFSVGAAGASTMITAILPTIVADRRPHVSTDSAFAQHGPQRAASISDATDTPSQTADTVTIKKDPAPTRSAALVGIFSGFGALLALLVFLRLPDIFQRNGINPVNALKDSYYLVGGLALFSSVICLYGLRNLHGEAGKGWKRLGQPKRESRAILDQVLHVLQAVTLAFRIPSLGLAYLGGFVARASSIGITLFVPLLVNTYYISAGLCDNFNQDPIDVRQKCRDAYVLSAKLTGVSQLIGLLFAPLFGFLADRFQHFNILLLFAASSGFCGYLLLTTLKSPEVDGENGTRWIYVIMALLGINQIGAIICSLGIFSRCILGLQQEGNGLKHEPVHEQSCESRDIRGAHAVTDEEGDQESMPLIADSSRFRGLHDLKGSIAGVYSLSGGVGILLLTKLGGVLFDKNPSAPFVMLSIFNALLFVAGITCGLSTTWRRKVGDLFASMAVCNQMLWDNSGARTIFAEAWNSLVRCDPGIWEALQGTYSWDKPDVHDWVNKGSW